MAKIDGGGNDAILEALDRQSRAVADQFLRECVSTSHTGQRLDFDGYLSQVPEAQRAQLRAALEQLVKLSNITIKSAHAADITLVHKELQSDVTTRADRSPSDVTACADQPVAAAHDAEITIDLSSPPADDSHVDVASQSDVTIDLPGSSTGVGATIDATATPRDAHKDQLFSWGPAGSSDEQPRGLPTVDGYQILGELGRGGMGVVYKARQRGLKRVVALKMILAGGHAGREQLERFRAEAEVVALLQHPNIVQIFDVGDRDGMPFFALEFIDGQALDQVIDGQPQLPTRSAEIVEKLAQAMHYAHQQGIVHRDLKPANILLTLEGVPKVTDFGLVKRLEADSGQTRTGTIMGTPSFMAPEQARGERQIGPAADTYALGSILYTMLTGRPPFMGPSALDTVMMVIRSEPVPPSRMQPKLPRDIEIICLKCLQKEPGKRYETAGDLAEDLRRFRAGEPILARPVGGFERTWRWCRRNPRVAILSAAASLLALLLMIGGPTAAVLINMQRNQAELARTAAEKAEGEALIAKDLADSARKAANENAAIASTQRQLAVNTLTTVVTKVEEELRDRSELNDLRQNVLDLAMRGLEEVSRTSETANQADRMIGATHQRMGDILLRAGKANDAREQYRKALAIFEQLLDANAPESDLVQWNAALAHDGLGDINRKQFEDAKIARDHYEQALRYRQALQTSATSPKLKPVMIRASLANSYGRISLLLLELLGLPQPSAEYSVLAIQQSEALLADMPDRIEPKQALAGAWNLYARALLHSGKTEQALDFAQRAMDLAQKSLAESPPESVKARQDVAICDRTLGDIALFSGKPAEALELYQAAHAVRLELYEQDQENVEMQEDLSKSFYRLGLAQLSLTPVGDATSSFERCRELGEQVFAQDPENASRQLELLQAQARCGDYASVAERADELRASLFPTPGTLLRIAGIYATCSQLALDDAASAAENAAAAKDLQDLAMGLVKEAIERGYRDSFALTTHPDLAGVRSAPGFDALAKSATSPTQEP